jgi:hypothetical protein
MKKIIALVVLIASATQANELEKSWNNFGKDNRAIYGAKALFATYLAYSTARLAYGEFDYIRSDLGETHLIKWLKIQDFGPGYGTTVETEMLLRNGILAGLSGYTAYLLSKQAWHDAKLAIGHKKEEQAAKYLCWALEIQYLFC